MRHLFAPSTRPFPPSPAYAAAGAGPHVTTAVCVGGALSQGALSSVPVGDGRMPCPVAPQLGFRGKLQEVLGARECLWGCACACPHTHTTHSHTHRLIPASGAAVGAGAAPRQRAQGNAVALAGAAAPLAPALAFQQHQLQRYEAAKGACVAVLLLLLLLHWHSTADAAAAALALHCCCCCRTGSSATAALLALLYIFEGGRVVGAHCSCPICRLVVKSLPNSVWCGRRPNPSRL